jgi:8-amino-7-oxononanoate synthase/acyl carrier protein
MKLTREQKCREMEAEPTLRGFFRVLCSDPHAPAAYWLDGDKKCSCTFGELYDNALRCAGRVETLGCGKKDGWVGIAADTCPQWPVLFWGLVAAGRRPLLLDAGLDGEKLNYLMAQAGAAALVSDRHREGINAPVFDMAELLNGRRAAGGGEWADMMAVCTSGTTQTSRVFVYSGRCVCLQAAAIIRQQMGEKITAEERGPLRTLCFLPQNHIFGFMTNMVWTWMLGYPQVFLKDRAPETIFRTCRQLKVQYATTVPLLVNNICATIRKRLAKEPAEKQEAFRRGMEMSLSAQRADPVAGLKLAREIFADIDEKLFGTQMEQIIIGGGHVPEENLRLINAIGYSTFCGFGMTEMAVTSAECRTDLDNRLSGSVGWPMEITKYRIIPDGEDPTRGELWIKCEAMHIGRLCGGELLPPELNADGWFETGDVVRMDDNKRTWVVGRVKDIIVGESGENVFPDEIEDSFADLPGAEQFSVLGVTDGNGIEKVALVMNVGAAYSDADAMNSLYCEIQKRNRALPGMKKAALAIVTPRRLPTASGIKIRRMELRRWIENKEMEFTVLDGKCAEAQPAADKKQNADLGRLKNEVRAVFAEVLELDPAEIADDSHFVNDLGGDSLQSISLAVKLEEKYDLLIPTEAFQSCVCVNDVAALISDLLNGVDRKKDERRKNSRQISRFEDTPEYAAFAKRQQGIEKLEHNPYFVCHESPLTDTSVLEDGRQVLNFGSYNYVCMSGRPETEEAAIAAIRKYGTSASGSRLLAGEKKVHQELEAAIAQWKHSEDALVLVGGHSTNVTIVGNFCGKNDLIVYDAIAHNSITEGCRLSQAASKPFPHNDMKALEGILRTQRRRFEKVLIVVEGVYSMDGDIAPIPELVELKKRYGCFLMVDEAHSACVLGETGGGVDEYFHLKHDDIDIKMGTLSKGLGTCGGYIAGRKCLIDYLRYSLPGFVFSVGISPALAAASLEAIRLLQTRPEILEDLHRNIDVFVSEAHKRNLNTCLAGKTAIIPILVGSDEDAFALSVELGNRGVFVPPAVYPAVPKGKARLRYCVTSGHKPEEIVKALDVLLETAEDMGIALPPMDPAAEQPVTANAAAS